MTDVGEGSTLNARSHRYSTVGWMEPGAYLLGLGKSERKNTKCNQPSEQEGRQGDREEITRFHEIV